MKVEGSATLYDADVTTVMKPLRLPDDIMLAIHIPLRQHLIDVLSSYQDVAYTHVHIHVFTFYRRRHSSTPRTWSESPGSSSVPKSIGVTVKVMVKVHTGTPARY